VEDGCSPVDLRMNVHIRENGPTQTHTYTSERQKEFLVDRKIL
jgi:hypothetical protein